MALLDRQKVLDRQWRLSEALASGVVLPFATWRANGEPDGVGVLLEADDALDHLADVAKSDVPTILLRFARYSDGRHYTHARLLRERHDYRGDIRAVGDVARDQLRYLWRCGFSSFALNEHFDPEEALRAFREFSVDYQAASDGAPSVYRRTP